MVSPQRAPRSPLSKLLTSCELARSASTARPPVTTAGTSESGDNGVLQGVHPHVSACGRVTNSTQTYAPSARQIHAVPARRIGRPALGKPSGQCQRARDADGSPRRRRAGRPAAPPSSQAAADARAQHAQTAAGAEGDRCRSRGRPWPSTRTRGRPRTESPPPRGPLDAQRLGELRQPIRGTSLIGLIVTTAVRDTYIRSRRSALTRNSSPRGVRAPVERGTRCSTDEMAGRTLRRPSPGTSLTTSGSRGRATICDSIVIPRPRSVNWSVSKTSTKRSRSQPTSDVERQPRAALPSAHGELPRAAGADRQSRPARRGARRPASRTPASIRSAQARAAASDLLDGGAVTRRRRAKWVCTRDRRDDRPACCSDTGCEVGVQIERHSGPVKGKVFRPHVSPLENAAALKGGPVYGRSRVAASACRTYAVRPQKVRPST